MNFLVTGGAGFIGAHVCQRLLADGHTVHVLDNLDPFYDPALKRRNLREIEAGGSGRFHFIHGDITQAATVEAAMASTRFDQIIHLAAQAGVRPSLETPASYQRVNVEGTVNVLEGARHHGIGKIVFASSSSVYGFGSKPPFREDQPTPSPISPYAASKLAGEALGHVYHHVHGMDVVVLRFFTVYGPRQRPDLAIAKFTRCVLEGQPISVFGDGSTARDYTFVEDIVDGIVSCTRRPLGFEIINLGGAVPVRLGELIALIETVTGAKAIMERQPPQPWDVPFTCADLGKANRLLGYAPKTSLIAGLTRYVRWLEKMVPDGGFPFDGPVK